MLSHNLSQVAHTARPLHGMLVYCSCSPPLQPTTDTHACCQSFANTIFSLPFFIIFQPLLRGGGGGLNCQHQYNKMQHTLCCLCHIAKFSLHMLQQHSTILQNCLKSNFYQSIRVMLRSFSCVKCQFKNQHFYHNIVFNECQVHSR